MPYSKSSGSCVATKNVNGYLWEASPHLLLSAFSMSKYHIVQGTCNIIPPLIRGSSLSKKFVAFSPSPALSIISPLSDLSLLLQHQNVESNLIHSIRQGARGLLSVCNIVSPLQGGKLRLISPATSRSKRRRRMALLASSRTSLMAR